MKNNKGFTLVEIIVVLVILAILAAATIPSMLGFVEQARAKSLTAEARAVYVAAQAVVTEKLAMATDRSAKTTELLTSLAGPAASNVLLSPYLKGDAQGTVSNIAIDGNGKVTDLKYTATDNKHYVEFKGGEAEFGAVEATP